MPDTPGPAPFRVDEFLHLLRARKLPWGSPFHFSERTGSTNDDALSAAQQGAVSGSLFASEHQSRGRGRQGKRWLSDAGQSLLFSIVLRPHQRLAEPARLTQSLTLAAGLGVRAALAKYLAPSRAATLKLKWPNDVVVQDSTTAASPRPLGKVAGILCEGQLTGSQLQAVVIGVGINVGEGPSEPELQEQASSLAQLAAQQPPSREALLVDVLEQMSLRIKLCTTGEPAGLLKEFRRYDALEGMPVCVQRMSTPDLCGTARGIDSQGRLLVETPQSLVPILTGTVRLLLN